MPQIAEFWSVWNLNKARPKKQYLSREEAIRDAKDVSIKENTPVHVIKCVGVAYNGAYIPVDPAEEIE